MSRHPNRHAATTVEFAIVFPIILMFLLGLFEIVSLYKINDAMSLSLFIGGREAMITTSSTTDIQDEVEQNLNHFGIEESTISIQPASITPLTNSITIDITVPANSMNGFPLTGTIFEGSVRRSVSIERAR